MAETPTPTSEDQDLVREVGETFFGHPDSTGKKVLWQAEMSRRLGISQSMLSAIAKGEQKLSLAMKAKLAAWAKAEIPKEQERRMHRKELLRKLRDRWQ